MTPSRVRRLLAAAVLLGLAVRLAHLAAVAASTLPRWQEISPGTDFGFAWDWAQRIHGGDWLGNPPYHPYSRWMHSLGTQADWARWWGGAGIFQQAPLYSYLIAWVCAPPWGSVLRMFVLQIALGVLCIPLVFWLARRWGDERTGLVAAFLWALCQTQVALEAFLLRDALVPPLLLGGLCLLEWMTDHPRARWIGLLAGLELGLAALLRENLFLVGLVGVPLGAWLAGRGRRLGAGAMVALGLTVGLSPLIARNLRVGVSPLALSNRAPEAILTGLSVSPGTDPLDFTIYPSMGADLEAAAGSSLGALRVVANQGARHPGLFLRRLGRKVWGWLSAYEPADNVDLPYLVLHSSALRLCLPTPLLLGPALLGLLLILRDPKRFVLLWVTLTVFLAPLGLIAVLWRIRANGLPFMAPLAAIAWVWVWDGVRQGRLLQVMPAVAGVGAFIAASYFFAAGPLGRIRSIEPSLAARVDLFEHHKEAALEEFDEYERMVREGHAQPSAAISALRARVEAEGEAAAGPQSLQESVRQ